MTPAIRLIRNHQRETCIGVSMLIGLCVLAPFVALTVKAFL